MDAAKIGTLKFLFRRARPTSNSKKVSIMPDLLVDKYSFPSGHASRATLLTLLLLNFNPFAHELLFNQTYQNLGINIFLCVLAFITCVSRFLLARHYFTDVLAGVLIGFLNYFILVVFLNKIIF